MLNLDSPFRDQRLNFKEFEPRLKSKTLLKHCRFQLKLYSVFWDLSRRAQLEPVFLGPECKSNATSAVSFYD